MHAFLFEGGAPNCSRRCCPTPRNQLNSHGFSPLHRETFERIGNPSLLILSHRSDLKVALLSNYKRISDWPI